MDPALSKVTITLPHRPRGRELEKRIAECRRAGLVPAGARVVGYSLGGQMHMLPEPVPVDEVDLRLVLELDGSPPVMFEGSELDVMKAARRWLDARIEAAG